MTIFRPLLLALGLASGMPASWAQTDAMPAPGATQQVLHLSASAQTEVPHDWLVLSLSVQKEGVQAAAVQQQINAVLTAAVVAATPSVKPGKIELSTGGMQVSPRYGRDGKINGWQGSAHLIFQGRDASGIATVAARLPDMSVTSIAWTLSEAQKKEAEMRSQAQAVDSFKSKAQSLAQQFGFASYVMKEVRVTTPDAGNGFQPRMAMAQMDAPVPSSLPVATVAGTAKVAVNITGSIQLK